MHRATRSRNSSDVDFRGFTVTEVAGSACLVLHTISGILKYTPMTNESLGATAVRADRSARVPTLLLETRETKRSMSNRNLAAILVAATAITGCSADPKSLSKSNLERAVLEGLRARGPTPVCPLVFPITRFHGGIQSAATKATVSAGLAQAVNASQPDETVVLTDAGKAVSILALMNLQVSGERYLCIGTPKIEIISNTEPADLLGRRVTLVKYRLTVTDLPAWATATDVQAELRAKGFPIDKPRELEAALVLTSKGWEPAL
jgi:hypothetical protein